MEIFQVVVIGIVSSILAVTVKKYSPQISIVITISAGIIIFMMAIPQLKIVLDMLHSIAQNVNLNQIYISIVLKIIAIAYIAEFGVQICKDAGENTIASKIEFVGKVLIMVVSAPILIALMELILTMMP